MEVITCSDGGRSKRVLYLGNVGGVRRKDVVFKTRYRIGTGKLEIKEETKSTEVFFWFLQPYTSTARRIRLAPSNASGCSEQLTQG